MFGFGRLLRDPKFPDPVVPPDLHLVKPARLDADIAAGTLRCVARFSAESSNAISSRMFESSHLDPTAVREALDQDLDRQTDRAIGAAVRKVQ